MSNQNIPPYDYQVWFKGSRRPILMAGMHEDHIRWQCDPKIPIKIKRIHIKEDITPDEPMGPKGSVVNRPADYDAGFRILKEWVDSKGGPSEDVRMRLRELFIDYTPVEKRKKTK
jgi:hypothetical protein